MRKNSALALFSLTLFLSLFASNAHASFFGDSLVFTVLSGSVIGYFLLLIALPLIAPKGKKLILFIASLIGPPSIAFLLILVILKMSYSESASIALWCGVFGLWTLGLLGLAFYLRQKTLIDETKPSTFNLNDYAKIAAMVIAADVLYSIGSDLYMAYQTNMDAAQFFSQMYTGFWGVYRFAMLGTGLYACFGLWRHQSLAWWIALITSIIPFGFLFLNGFGGYADGSIPFTYLFHYLTPILVIVLLLQPKTRQLCKIDFSA